MSLILPQIVDVCVHSKTIKYYKDLGYEIPLQENRKVKIGTKIKVHVLDLPNGSHAEVKVQCDNCGDVYYIPYRGLLKNYNKSNRVFCSSCAREENRQCIDYFSEDKHCSKWQDEKYAREQLKIFIEKYGTLKGMSLIDPSGANILANFRKYNHSLKGITMQLGYDYNKLKGLYYDEGYLDNFSNFEKVTNDFIEENGYFPTLKNYKHDLHIPESVVQKHGTMAELQKRIMGDNNNLLEDDSGFFNRSHYEYIVAQFLIHNDIRYKREQYPFTPPNHLLRSDFTIYTSTEEYHVEIWGFYKTDNTSSRSHQYNKKRMIKEELYKQHGIKLISINPDIFNHPLNEIQALLTEIFQPILDQKLSLIDVSYLINPTKLSDEELLAEIMKYSTNDKLLPYQSVLQEKCPSILNEMLKRYGNQNTFARKMGKMTHSKKKMWDKDFALNLLIYIHDKYNCIPTRTELNYNEEYKSDDTLIGMSDGLPQAFGTYTDGVLVFYEFAVENSINFSDRDLEYLTNLKNGRFFGRMATEERKFRATKILNTYAIKIA